MSLVEAVGPAIFDLIIAMYNDEHADGLVDIDPVVFLYMGMKIKEMKPVNAPALIHAITFERMFENALEVSDRGLTLFAQETLPFDEEANESRIADAIASKRRTRTPRRHSKVHRMTVRDVVVDG
jgi:hypothetical protein